MEKIYRCVCGREFKSSQSINGHKANCIEYLETQFDNAEAILHSRQWHASHNGNNSAECRKQRYDLNNKLKLELWISEKHKCEKCGKIMTEYYGSGRFCSEYCARSISNYKPEKHTESYTIYPYTCSECGKGFNSEKALNIHIAKNHKHIISKRYVKVRNNVELDITVEELNEYKKTHNKCEICGRTLDKNIKNSDETVSYLCVDHVHSSSKFRGLLCSYCNGALGWFEHNKDNVLNYLNTKGQEDS